MKFIILLLSCFLMLTGCRGWESEKTAVHINPNMDWQPKLKAQTMPLDIPEGTVPYGDYASNTDELSNRERYIKSNTALHTGMSASGYWVTKAPIDVSKEVVLRGQERYNIYCSMCHDMAGTGKGTVIAKGFVPPPNLSDERIVNYKDGQIFDIITNGIRNMPAYKKQIPVEDRWAIVTYVRALQKSRNASINELSEIERAKLDR